MKSNYSKYKIFKKKFHGLIYKGIALDYALGSYLAQYVWSNKKVRFILGLLFEGYKLDYSYISKKKNEYDVFTYYIERDDYRKLIEGYIEKSDTEYELVKIESEKKWKNLFLSLTYIYESWVLSRGRKFGVIDLLFVAFSLRVIDKIGNLNFKGYMSFNSAFKYESFLSLYFNARDVETFSIQHGAYFNFKNDTPIDVINYENLCSSNLLCWGQYTVDQIKNLVPKYTNIVNYGYPLVHSANNYKPQKENKAIYILVPRSIYKEEILNLFKILKDTGEEFVIRPHPSVKKEIGNYITTNKLEWIIDDKETMHSLLRKYKFKACISFNSTALFECILFNQNAIQYVSDNDEFILDNLCKFNNIITFKNAIETSVKQTVDVSYFFKSVL
ncbi:hypothetical protein CS022_00070 [Veronia nyctiphanis]|uniref:Uncharacterized protein n=1 Tax=Veronia nyctiphanis TaxID=1278244 RepID=A0A4Q0YTV3_9GAMM|nr:hypothetical protein [Veronia nyctiphanis]RXJ74687.1 hypothetical protein CS022_00070 [Veronia nyctiphanis]